jgi:hypothetical protein
MQTARKNISSLFFLIMLLPLFCCMLIKIKQQRLKEEARENLQKLLLKKITLSSGDFQWTEDGKEISINGDLFDVKCYSVENDKFIFIGLFDKEETALNKLQPLPLSCS